MSTLDRPTYLQFHREQILVQTLQLRCIIRLLAIAGRWLSARKSSPARFWHHQVLCKKLWLSLMLSRLIKKGGNSVRALLAIKNKVKTGAWRPKRNSTSLKMKLLFKRYRKCWTKMAGKSIKHRWLRKVVPTSFKDWLYLHLRTTYRMSLRHRLLSSSVPWPRSCKTNKSQYISQSLMRRRAPPTWLNQSLKSD